MSQLRRKNVLRKHFVCWMFRALIVFSGKSSTTNVFQRREGKLVENGKFHGKEKRKQNLPLAKIVSTSWWTIGKWRKFKKEICWNESFSTNSDRVVTSYAWLFSFTLFFFPCYVFADKMPVEKRDSIISEKKISPNGQGLYLLFQPKNKRRRKRLRR